MKIIKVFLIVLSLIMLFSVSAYAENEEINGSDEIIGGYSEEITDSLDEETKKLLSQFGLDAINTDSFLNLSFKDVFSIIKSSFTLKIKESISSVIKAFGMLFLIITINSFRRKDSSDIISDIFSMSVIISISYLIFDVIKILSAVIKATKGFLMSLIPIITVLLSFSGNVTFSGVYSGMMIGFCNVIIFAADNIIIPFIGIYFALVIAMSFNDISDAASLCAKINGISAAILGIISTLFSLFLSAKGILSKDLDGVIYKSGKYIISSFIPIIGNAMGGILNYIVGSINIIKSTVGIFAVIAAVCIYLPMFIQIFLCRMYLGALSFIGEGFGERKAVSVVKCISKSLNLISVFSFFVLITVIVSTGLAVGIRGNIG